MTWSASFLTDQKMAWEMLSLPIDWHLGACMDELLQPAGAKGAGGAKETEAVFMPAPASGAKGTRSKGDRSKGDRSKGDEQRGRG